MSQLGKRLWDDDGRLLATILPYHDAIDIGSAAHPFRNAYFSGDLSFDDVVFTGDMTVGDDIVFSQATTVDHSISNPGGGAITTVWVGTSFGNTTSSYITMAGPTHANAGDVQINSIDDIHFLNSGSTAMVLDNGAREVQIGSLYNLVIFKDDGGIRRGDNTGRMFISGGSTLDTSTGPVIALAGISDSAAGLFQVQGAAVSTGHIGFRILHASAEVRVSNTGNATLWSFTNSGLLKPATQQTYTITNDSTDRAFDANTVAVDELADVVATLIKDLQALGFVLTA